MRTNNQLYTKIRPSNYFYYDGMNASEKRAYNEIYNGLIAKKKKIEIDISHKSHLKDLIFALQFDHPELFYVNLQQFSFAYSASKLIFQPQYLHTDKVDLINQKIDEIINRVKQKKGLINRLLAICDIYYNFEYGPCPNNDEYTIYGPLIMNKGVCQGFSCLFKLLCQKVGIECIVISGDLSGNPHAYNVIELNNRLYYVDITNSLSYYNGCFKEMKYIHVAVPDYALVKGAYKNDLRFECISYQENPYYLLGRAFIDTLSFHDCVSNNAKFKKDVTLVDLSKNGLFNSFTINLAIKKLGAKSTVTMGRYVKFKL